MSEKTTRPVFDAAETGGVYCFRYVSLGLQWGLLRMSYPKIQPSRGLPGPFSGKIN